MTPTPKQQIESLGAGVFIRDRNIESRLLEADFHRAFSEPVVVWFTPTEYQERTIELVLDASKRLHAVQCFRFPNICVSAHILDRIRSEFPTALIEGGKKGKPNQRPLRTALAVMPTAKQPARQPAARRRS